MSHGNNAVSDDFCACVQVCKTAPASARVSFEAVSCVSTVETVVLKLIEP
jgi:hypothetical protein